jgi:hypothetical protein
MIALREQKGGMANEKTGAPNLNDRTDILENLEINKQLILGEALPNYGEWKSISASKGHSYKMRAGGRPPLPPSLALEDSVQ